MFRVTSITIQQMAGLSETLGLTFAANGKLQIFKGKYHNEFPTAKLLIHASILMYNAVQIVPNSNSQLLTSKYDLKFGACG